MSKTMEDLFLLENYLLGLVFPEKGYVFFHIERIEDYEYLYDRILDVTSLTTAGQISADEHLSSVRLLDEDANDILEVENKDHIYQIFYGINPSPLKTYWYFTKTMARGAPDVTSMVDKAKWGYIDGFKSPLLEPSVKTEKFIPYGENLTGFAFHNPTTVPIRRADNPMLKFEGKMYGVSVIKDVDLIEAILRRRPGGQARLATLGGLETFTYDIKDVYGVNPVPFRATRAQIQEAVK